MFEVGEVVRRAGRGRASVDPELGMERGIILLDMGSRLDCVFVPWSLPSKL